MDEPTWVSRMALPLSIASLLYLVSYSWLVIADLVGPPRTAALVLIVVTWVFFIVDYLVRLTLADDRWRWFRKHPGALAFALLPVLRLVLLLDRLTQLPGLRRTRGAALRTRIAVYGGGAVVVLVYIASLSVLEAERHAPGADIVDFGVALWWSCVTVTTTGFGDYVPVTLPGRAVAVGLMFGGIILSGIITATLASWILERASRGHDDEEPATRGQARAIMARIDGLGRPADPQEPDATHG
ncbi:potassium channel family protein [Microbacterium sp.]|jgi:voltage-gated potassium channel|uniref:potassium channel family protein n=1 Tax=Microbacterium sp. TaxID=51671 RepID=UPI002CD6889C|nr:potassium channel family protein [Microbacterium sp.]HWL77323.1 potassium channel family protein [Microbacterium sp.]